MTELEYIRNKYKNKSFIEINPHVQQSVIKWLGGDVADGQSDMRKICESMSQRGFIKFLDEGVIIVKHSSPNQNTRFYPFKFTDDGKLQVSVYINNPYSENPVNTLELLCKVQCGIDTMYTVIENSYNEQLAADHIATEFQAERMGVSQLLPIIKIVREKHPNLKPETKEWNLEVSKEYFTTIIKAQLISIIGINAYLTLLNKDILISRIEQKREMKAGNSGGKKSKRNPLYRYVVELPPNYKPRKFNLNYVLSHWERAGHMTTRWVRPENAETLAARRKGRVTGRMRGNLVAIEIPVQPAMCYRKVTQVDENMGVKQYTDT